MTSPSCSVCTLFLLLKITSYTISSSCSSFVLYLLDLPHTRYHALSFSLENKHVKLKQIRLKRLNWREAAHVYIWAHTFTCMHTYIHTKEKKKNGNKKCQYYQTMPNESNMRKKVYKTYYWVCIELAIKMLGKERYLKLPSLLMLFYHISPQHIIFISIRF